MFHFVNHLVPSLAYFFIGLFGFFFIIVAFHSIFLNPNPGHILSYSVTYFLTHLLVPFMHGSP